MSSRTRAAASLALIAAAVCSTIRGEADRHHVEAPVKTLALTSTREEIGMEYQFFGETIRRSNGGRIRYSNHYIQEYFAGRANGYVYHPRLATFSSGIKLGYAHQRLNRSDGDTDEQTSSNDALLGYDVRVDFLREHPFSGTLESSRDERILMGLFVDRFLVKTDSQRGTLRWNRPGLQMDATATHSTLEEFGAVSNSRTVSDTLAYNLHHQVGRGINTDARYTLQRYDRRFRADTANGDIDNESTLESQTAQVNNRIDLMPDRRATLRSTVRLHDQSNNQDLRTYFWQERLQMRHTEDLRSYALASAQRSEYRTRTVDTLRGEAGVDHDLFKSLKSHLDLHGRRTDYGEVTETRVGPTGRLNYRKNTAAGVFSAGYARTLDYVERSGGTASNEIIDESIVVTIATPTFLENAQVVASSIVVTDTENQVTFVEGFDYEVVPEGQRTGLRVLPGGLLEDGATVLVDYRVEVDGDLSYIADDQTVNVRHDFQRYVPGLSLYAQRHDLMARSVESETDPRILEYVDQSAGLRQAWRAYAFTAEYQQYDDDLGGYDQWRTMVEGNHRLSPRIGLGWNAGYTSTNYDTQTTTDFEDCSRYYFAGGHVDGTFGRNGFWRLEERSVHETGRTDQTVNGVLARVGFDWRRLSVEGGGRYEIYDYADSERDRTQVFVGVKWRLAQWLAPGEKR